jgi:hypothetical protein
LGKQEYFSTGGLTGSIETRIILSGQSSEVLLTYESDVIASLLRLKSAFTAALDASAAVATP